MPCPHFKNVSQMYCKCNTMLANSSTAGSAKFANRSHTPTMARDWWLKASIFGTSPHRHGCTRIPTPQERCTRISTPLERCIRISTLLGLHEDFNTTREMHEDSNTTREMHEDSNTTREMHEDSNTTREMHEDFNTVRVARGFPREMHDDHGDQQVTSYLLLDPS